MALIQSAGLGFLAGLAFLLPVLVWLLGEPGTARTVGLLIAAVPAMAIVRRCGQALFAVMERVGRGGRPGLLLVYGLLAMAPLLVVVLEPPRWAH
ncbi:MAG: hypothetical protein INR65_08445 [Gluconacetobacter diazotrophicus]|nr:hypothetical protein [Gluconacetobacter diazotrophicus]